MVQIKIGSLVKFYIILLLSEGPKHGYEIMKSLEQKIGKTIGSSQIYPFLELLEKEKLIKVEKIEVKDKKIYSLTKNGNDFIQKMLSRTGDLFYIALKPRLSICTHCGCKIIEGGYKGNIKNKELTFCCHHCANSYKKEN